MIAVGYRHFIWATRPRSGCGLIRGAVLDFPSITQIFQRTCPSFGQVRDFSPVWASKSELVKFDSIRADKLRADAAKIHGSSRAPA
jgi:hypothetical protein